MIGSFKNKSFRGLGYVFYHVLGASKGTPFSVFFLQTEHLPLQTHFKERAVGGLEHSVSNVVFLLASAWGAAGHHAY